MSPQSALAAKNCSMYCGESSKMSNSQIVQAADEAFSRHRRLDVDCEYSNNAVMSNPLDLSISSSSRFQLRKRKKQLESVNPMSNFDGDFVSGLFRDLSETEQHEPDSHGSDSVNEVTVADEDLSRPSKRFKATSNNVSMSRSCKSFSCLTNLDRLPSPTSNHDRRVSVDIKHQVSPSNSASEGTFDSDLILRLVDKVLVESLAFPRLPPTVSETSCSSNNLTQTSVHAAQVLETPPYIEGEQKETYGWFVDMDLDDIHERADVVSAAQQSLLSGSTSDLSFQGFTAPKKTDLDEEVEWAKAADTVDDVLGDFF